MNDIRIDHFRRVVADARKDAETFAAAAVAGLPLPNGVTVIPTFAWVCDACQAIHMPPENGKCWQCGHTGGSWCQARQVTMTQGADGQAPSGPAPGGGAGP